MAANFPNSPSNGDEFTSNSVTFTWDGSAWKQSASPGVKGLKGDKGEKGDKGQKGEKGDKGQKGEVGLSGNPGGDGDKGDKGDKGQKGVDGTLGAKGQKGEKGEKGEVGDKGVKGDKGDKGQKGVDGTLGAKGQKGQKGEKGEKGQEGSQGTVGDKGQKGEQNDKGQKGEPSTVKGQKGEVGAQGDGGSDGIKGQKGEKGEVGDKGVKGEIGDKGVKGEIGVGVKGQKGEDNSSKGQKGEEGPQGGGAPVGQIVAWSGSAGSLPTGYFLCDGSAISRTTYAALYSIVGTTHGSGNGSSTFNIPDLRDRFVLGASNSTGDTTYPGVSPGATGGYTDVFIPEHTHTFSGSSSHSHTVNNHTHSFSGSGSSSHTHNIFSTNIDDHNDSARRIQNGRNDRTSLYPSNTNFNTDSATVSISVSGTTGGSSPGTNSQTVSISGTTANNTGGAAITNAQRSGRNIPPFYALAYIIQYAQGGETAKGQKGEGGDKGQKGEQNDKGQKGEIGAGTKGQKGEEGDKGQKGEDGTQGVGGTKGEKGQKGQGGTDGSDGTKGQKGEIGTQGTGGNPGAKGEKGQKGEQGAGGTDGSDGDKGQKGEGDKGQKGEAGSGGSVGGSANQVVYKNSSNVATGSNNFTFNGSMLKTNGTISVGAGHPTSNFYSGADDLVVANFAQDTGISIMSGTSNEANVAFGSTTFGSGAIQARLYYDSGNDKFVMNTLTTGHDIEIKSAGTITLGDLNNPTLTIDDMTQSGSNYGVEVDGTIYPKITGAAHGYRDLGLSGVRWTNVYATNLHGDGSNITNVSNTAARKVRIAENTGTISGNYGSYTNVLNISSFVPNSTNSVFLITVTIGNFYRSSGSGSAWGRMLINDNGTQVDGVEHYFQTDTDSGSKNISIIDTRGGTSARNYGIQLMRGNNNGVPSIQNIRIMCIEMDTSI